MLGEVDGAHSATPQLAQDSVLADVALAWKRRRRGDRSNRWRRRGWRRDRYQSHCLRHIRSAGRGDLLSLLSVIRSWRPVRNSRILRFRRAIFGLTGIGHRVVRETSRAAKL